MTEPRLCPALLQQHFRRKPERRGDVGNDRGMEGDSLKTTVHERLAGDLDDPALATSLDHLGQQAANPAALGAKATGLMIRRLASRDKPAASSADAIAGDRRIEAGAEWAGCGPITEAE